MQLVIDNTSKSDVRIGGLVLPPGKTTLNPDQLKAWRALRAVGTSRELFARREMRWPVMMQNLLANRTLCVVSASGSDERSARRGQKLTKKPTTKPAASSTMSKAEKR